MPFCTRTTQVQCELVAVEGDPRELIVAQAKQANVDCVVMGRDLGAVRGMGQRCDGNLHPVGRLAQFDVHSGMTSNIKCPA